jgi:hypothetical protein
VYLFRPHCLRDRIQSIGQRRRPRLQNQRRFDLDDAVVGNRWPRFASAAMQLLPIVLLLCEHVSMRRLLPVVKTIATVVVGLGLVVVTTWWGLSQLYRVLSTGELFSRLYGPGYVGWSRLISFESDPIHFVAALGASVLATAFGLYVFSQLFVKVRRWWSAR